MFCVMKTAGYQPDILADTTTLSRPEWLEYRRKGLGGSDAAAVLGVSPFRTARDLYYDKTGVVTADNQENWVALEIGNLLNPWQRKSSQSRPASRSTSASACFSTRSIPGCSRTWTI